MNVKISLGHLRGRLWTVYSKGGIKTNISSKFARFKWRFEDLENRLQAQVEKEICDGNKD